MPLLRVLLSYGIPPGPCSPDAWTAAGGGVHLEVDFTLSAQHSVLFGASGTGKSTLLRLIAGLLEPTSGTIALGEVVLTDIGAGFALPPGRRGIGYLTQDPALFPHLSVAQNIAYGLNSLPREACRARVSALLALFSLEALAGRLPLRLSGGERQRVALARTLAAGPSLLLLDEPFSGLDTPLRDKTIAALDQYLRTRQTTVLSVSHDVAEVYASGAEVLVLEAGRISAQGPSRQVLAPHRERLLKQLDADTAGTIRAIPQT
jgi:ABC-type sulfate/molybdate transport systems ATPase subunit